MSLLRPHYKARFLLTVQLILIVSSVSWDTMAGFWLSVVFPVSFAMGGAILANERRWFFSYCLLSLAAFGLNQVDLQIPRVLSLLCMTGAFAMLFREIVRHSFFKPSVPRVDRVIAGISGYLLLGFFWCLCFHVAGHLEPGSIVNQMTANPPSISDQLYFSFVTMTTLGYGEIVPVGRFAKVLVILTTLSGTLYLAIFISALIGGARSAITGRDTDDIDEQ